MGSSESKSEEKEKKVNEKDTSRVSINDKTIIDLKSKIRLVDNKLKETQQKIEFLKESALNFVKSKNKNRAILEIRKKKLYENQYKHFLDVQFTLEQMNVNLQGAIVDNATISVLKECDRILKDLTSKYSVEDLEEIKETLSEAEERNRQIIEILDEGIENDPELEEEYENFEERMIENENNKYQPKLVEAVAIPDKIQVVSQRLYKPINSNYLKEPKEQKVQVILNSEIVHANQNNPSSFKSPDNQNKEINPFEEQKIQIERQGKFVQHPPGIQTVNPVIHANPKNYFLSDNKIRQPNMNEKGIKYINENPQDLQERQYTQMPPSQAYLQVQTGKYYNQAFLQNNPPQKAQPIYHQNQVQYAAQTKYLIVQNPKPQRYSLPNSYQGQLSSVLNKGNPTSINYIQVKPPPIQNSDEEVSQYSAQLA